MRQENVKLEILDFTYLSFAQTHTKMWISLKVIYYKCTFGEFNKFFLTFWLLWGKKCSTSQRYITLTKHTLAVYDGKKLFQYEICDYCCFQFDIKTHKKTWSNGNSQFFSKQSIATHARKEIWTGILIQFMKLFNCKLCNNDDCN